MFRLDLPSKIDLPQPPTFEHIEFAPLLQKVYCQNPQTGRTNCECPQT